MTPQERQLIDDLFDRLARLEAAPRDTDAVRAIAQANSRAPNALYALVQTTLLQDEALRRANDRIEALESGQTDSKPGSFLDSMRDAVFGGSPARGSVPNVRPADNNRPVWNTGGTGFDRTAPAGGPYNAPPGFPQQAGGGGGSFLGTAAAAAAGMVGGSLLLNSIRGMMGGSQHGFGDQAGLNKSGDSKSPWSDSGTGDLSRDAGVNDIGKQSDSSRAGVFDRDSSDSRYDTASNEDDDDGFDGDDGDSDSA